MGNNSSNAHAYGDTLQVVATAPLGVAAPTLPPPAALASGWQAVGWIADTGVTETPGMQETKKYGWQGSGLIRVLRTQHERTFEFECLEENAVVMGLIRNPSVTTTTGATAEVQTITITGTPTGGTFTPSLNGYGSTTAQAYNVSTAALATALTALVGAAVSVSGTAGSSYVCTFPIGLGNIAQMTVAYALTGGTTPAATPTTTTPGVTGTNSTGIQGRVSQDRRQFAIDLIDGAVHRRKYIPNGEATLAGPIPYTAADLTGYKIKVDCFVDAAGFFYYDLDDNPATASGLFV